MTNDEAPSADDAPTPSLAYQFVEIARPETGEFLWLAVIDEETHHLWVYDFDTQAFHFKPGLRADYLIDQDLNYRSIDRAEAQRIAVTTYRGIAAPARDLHANDPHAVPGHQVLGTPAAQGLSKKGIDESIRFADSALAAAGHTVNSPESDADIRAAVTGGITYDEAVRRAIAGATTDNDKGEHEPPVTTEEAR